MAVVASIDLNADLGEGFGAWHMGDDSALLAVVTSANVACGFHAGDPSIMRRTCALAAERGVVVGAHVSYRDLAGFGRRDIDISSGELADEVLYQLGALDACCRAAGTRVRYVKPHGALYNRAHHDDVHAAAVVSAVRSFDTDLAVLGAPGSRLLALAAEAQLATFSEGFADRAYERGGTLVPRGTLGAVHHDAAHVVAQALSLATSGTVAAIDGTVVAVPARSLCVHGDTPGAVELARSVRAALEAAGVTLVPFR
jgi:UPF0271 protein